MNYENAISLTSKFNQEHLLGFYNELSVKEQKDLLNQIATIDFKLMASLYSELVENKSIQVSGKIEPIKSVRFEELSIVEKENYCNLGIEAIRNGKVAAFLLAGGQGTRLGYNGPKGTFNIGLPSNKSLFQLQAERLINLRDRAGAYITWYIMTSPENNDETIDFFASNNYFGYDETHIKFFKQGVLPMVDEKGKIILEEKGNVAMGPDGNGGCFIGLKESGMLEDMKTRGIEWISLFGVDNALVRPGDPYFLGFTISSGELVGTKVIDKRNENEKVGILCYSNGKPSIVEYSEMPEELSKKRDSAGKLVYNEANILNHIVNLKFIENSLKEKIPYHAAYKKIPFINNNGLKTAPPAPNGYKFESFMFDFFNNLSDMAVLKVKREDEFAPVKNSEGEDSPEIARNMILNMHRKWLFKIGFNMELIEDRMIEISPLVSYDGENIDINRMDDLINKQKINIIEKYKA